MNSREKILSAIRQNKPSFTSVPSSVDFKSNYEDLLVQFDATLKGIGGSTVVVKSYDDIKEYVRKNYKEVTNIATPLTELSDIATFSLNIDDPHDLETVDLAIIAGDVAVAENAAIWISDSYSSHRALLFITQYLAIVIQKSAIVGNMHKAYQHVKIDETGWGCWVAGPSKTADIEQSLVIGAHGARGLIVFIME